MLRGAASQSAPAADVEAGAAGSRPARRWPPLSPLLPRLAGRKWVRPACAALLALAALAGLLRPWRAQRAAAGALRFSSLPTFLINGAEDYAARKWAEQQLASVGIRSYERINGVVLEADDCQRLSGTGCQQGLALGHLAAWRRVAERRLPAALVLEDDVTWHSDFETLLPRYLAAAPRDWRVIWLGQLRREGMGLGAAPPSERLATSGEAPWTLHAYLLTWQAAELLSRHYDFLLARGQSAHASAPFPYSGAAELAALPWALSHRELKSDYFIGLAFHYFVPSDERRLWVSFQSTARVPARLGARSWVSGEENELGRLRRTRCTCEALGDAAACPAEETERLLPLMGAGLAYQNLCRYRRWALYNWVGAPGAAVAPSCAWLRARIAPSARSDPSPHDCVDDVYPAMPKSLTPKAAVGGGNADEKGGAR